MESFSASHSIKQSTAPRNSSPSPEPSPPSAEGNIFQWLWNVWSTVTGPRKETFKKDIFAQERLRHARLVSALLMLIVFVEILLFLTVYSSPSLWIPIGILAGGGIIIAIFNRAGYTTASSICYILLVDMALTGFFLFKPDHVLNSVNMTAFDLFIITVLVGGVILPKALIPLTGMMQILLIGMIFFLIPHSASINELVQEAGNAYSALLSTIVLHVVGTALAWLNAWSVERALIRASQAEELAEARAALSEQALITEVQKQRLEEGITSILETHRQIAAGNLAARAPVHEDHELWQIGHALNFLLMRVQQQSRDYRILQATHQEVEKVIYVLDAADPGSRPILPPCRTPLAQRLLLALKRRALFN